MKTECNVKTDRKRDRDGERHRERGRDKGRERERLCSFAYLSSNRGADFAFLVAATVSSISSLFSVLFALR